MKAAIRLLILLSLIPIGVQAHADYCQRLFTETSFPPGTGAIASVFRLDRDRGVVVASEKVKSLHLVRYSNETSHRLESRPEKTGPLKNIKLGFQIFDKGGEPREFEITTDFIQNYFVKPPRNAPAVKAYIHRYQLAFRNGACVPLKISVVGVEGEEKIFDFDRCHELMIQKKPLTEADAPLKCESLKILTDLLKDPQFAHGETSQPSGPNGNASR